MMYEMLAASDVNKSGYATYEEFLKMSSEGHPPGELEEVSLVTGLNILCFN